MSTPRLLDAFCGAGGASRGYADAGFDVTGIDIRQQKNYPFTFIQEDFMETLHDTEFLKTFDVITASPPCHDHSQLSRMTGNDGTGWMLEEVVRSLAQLDLPVIVENVPEGTHDVLKHRVILCGSSFGLKVRRHRLFASTHRLSAPPCNHAAQGKPVGVHGHSGGKSNRTGERYPSKAEWDEAMGIDWMSESEITQAIPPLYTRHIGLQLRAYLR